MVHITLQMGEYSFSHGPGAYQFGLNLNGTDAYYWTPAGIQKAQYRRRMWVQLFDIECTRMPDLSFLHEWTQVSAVGGRYVGFFRAF